MDSIECWVERDKGVGLEMERDKANKSSEASKEEAEEKEEEEAVGCGRRRCRRQASMR